MSWGNVGWGIFAMVAIILIILVVMLIIQIMVVSKTNNQINFLAHKITPVIEYGLKEVCKALPDNPPFCNPEWAPLATKWTPIAPHSK